MHLVRVNLEKSGINHPSDYPSNGLRCDLNNIFKLGLTSNSSLSNGSRWTSLSNVKYIMLSAWSSLKASEHYLVDERKVKSPWFSQAMSWLEDQMTGV